MLSRRGALSLMLQFYPENDGPYTYLTQYIEK
jgi:hypothetical protein